MAAALVCSNLIAATAQAAVPAQAPAHAVQERPIELHERLVEPAGGDRVIALTLDLCGGSFDQDLFDFLVDHRIPATIFVTKRWLDRHAAAADQLRAHADLFELEDHGAAHVPAVIGAGKRVYGIAGEPDLAHLRAEVDGGAQAVESLTGHKPHWYRGATALYDRSAIAAIEQMGYAVAGFSLNADAGATLSRREVAARVLRAQPGDVILAHLNKPQSDTAEGMMQALPVLLARGYTFAKLDEHRLAEVAARAAQH